MSTAHFVPDESSLGRPATTPARRIEALIKCLANHWADRDIAVIERIENAPNPGWRMQPSRRPAKEGAD